MKWDREKRSAWPVKNDMLKGEMTNEEEPGAGSFSRHPGARHIYRNFSIFSTPNQRIFSKKYT